MNNRIRSIGGVAADWQPGAVPPTPPDAGYRPSTHAVAGERLACLVLDRDDPTAAAEHRIALAAQLPLAPLMLLQERRGFTAALSGIYGADLADGFDQVVCIQRLDTTRVFAADAGYREAVVAHLCQRTMNHSGFVAIHPASGMWRRNSGSAPMAPPANQTLALCHLFGSCGFAQLCDDDVLERPVPVFLQPWSREHGLLRPECLPRERFSRSICVQRLGAGRMVLFDRN